MNTIPMYRPNSSTEPAEFNLVSAYEPAGDQPQAIQALIDGLKRGERNQVLLGVTGSGKTFTMAHIIKQMKRPALILAPNKILAARCILPVSDNMNIPGSMGLRHRAAIGMSAATDAHIVVVSEETGNISFVKDGHFKVRITPEELNRFLHNDFSGFIVK